MIYKGKYIDIDIYLPDLIIPTFLCGGVLMLPLSFQIVRGFVCLCVCVAIWYVLYFFFLIDMTYWVKRIAINRLLVIE